MMGRGSVSDTREWGARLPHAPPLLWRSGHPGCQPEQPTHTYRIYRAVPLPTGWEAVRKRPAKTVRSASSPQDTALTVLPRAGDPAGMPPPPKRNEPSPGGQARARKNVAPRQTRERQP